MSARDELIRAFTDNDHDTVRMLGWWDVWGTLHGLWDPKKKTTAKDMVWYATALGDENPADVLDAVLACAGDFRPTAGQLRGYLNRQRGEDPSARVDVGRSTDIASDPRVLANVREALRNGAHACECGHSPPGVPWLRGNRDGVLRCPDCDGIQDGQIYNAEDAEQVDNAPEGAGRLEMAA